MRLITKKIGDAFEAGTARKLSNTEVCLEGDEVIVRLHGNAILRRKVKGETIRASAAGWSTLTTKERLNGVLSRYGVNIWQDDYTWYWVSRRAGPQQESLFGGEEPRASMPAVCPRPQVFPTRHGVWTVVVPGSDLELLAGARRRL